MEETRKNHYDIFISYGRKDCEELIKKLHNDLENHGFSVWWDRDSMKSRGRTFLQELRDAIDDIDRVIVAIGPAAAQSEYVRAEWDHARLFCKDVVPSIVLSLGDKKLIPEKLCQLHCVDFRFSRPYDEAFEELLHILSEPVPPLAALRNVPSLPPNFLPREKDIYELSSIILADTKKPTVITSDKRTTALQGMAGIGKSVLAAAFSRTAEVRRNFSDGIIWINVGQNPDLHQIMKQIGTPFEIQFADIGEAKSRLPDILEHKVVFFVLDNVWDVDTVSLIVNLIGPRCRLLITTRDAGIVTSLGAQEQRVDVLSETEAKSLLANWYEQDINDLPPEASDIINVCDRLPLAIALCGAMIRDGFSWSDLLEAFQDCDLEYIEKKLPNYPYPNIMKSLAISMDALRNENSDYAGYYQDLVAFRHDEPIPESAVTTMWLHRGIDKDRNARKLLTTLERKSLLRLEEDVPKRLVSLHDLQYDYLKARADDASAISVFGLPHQLSVENQWEELYTLLSTPKMLQLMWYLDGCNVKNYWMNLEKNSSFMMKNAYNIENNRELLEDDEYMSITASLLDDAGYLEEAMKLYQKLEERCRTIGDQDNLQRSLKNQALILKVWGRLDEAMELYKEEEQICRKLGNLKDLQISLGNQGIIHKTMGQLDEAMELYKEEEQICRELGNHKDLQVSLGNQGIINKIKGQLDEAVKVHKKQEQICRELSDHNGLQKSLVNQANVHMIRGQLDEAMKLYKEGESICCNLDILNDLQGILGSQGVIHQIRDQLDEAMKLYKGQERICRELGMFDSLQTSLCNQVDIHQSRGQLDEAMKLHNQQEQICRKLKNKGNLQISFGNHTLILQARGLHSASTPINNSLDIHRSETTDSERENISIEPYSLHSTIKKRNIYSSNRKYPEEKTKKDYVNFTLTAPSIMTSGGDYEIGVWACLKENEQEMIEAAEELHETDDINKKSKKSVPLDKETSVTVIIDIPDFEINDTQDTIYWDGELTNATLMVNLPENFPSGQYRGKLLFLVEGLQIAKLNFKLCVKRVSNIPVVTNSAFVSYASKDRDAVLARIHLLEKIIPGIDLFLGLVSLHSEEDWYKILTEEIKKRDIFYLFWSEAASKSEWVEKEWKIALESKGIEFINIIPLVSPDKVPLPKELASLHFNNKILAYSIDSEREKLLIEPRSSNSIIKKRNTYSSNGEYPGEKTRKDTISFSLTSPSTMFPGNKYIVDVWAYLKHQEQEMIEKAKVNYRTENFSRERENRITVFIQIPDFEINSLQNTIYWNREITNASFWINVPEGLTFGKYRGKLFFLMEGLQIARLNFDLNVGGGEVLNSVFISYASKDRDSVLARVHMLKKIIPDIDLFLDLVSLHSGEDWYKRLIEEIKKRDVFYLFWSEAASKSEWVEKEWRTALELKGLENIIVIPLVSPEKIPLPKELASLRINDWILDI